MQRVVIIGGGISGLALAYRLRVAVPTSQVTVLEKDSRPGGAVWTLRQDGFQVETGPNGFLDSKPTTIALCRDLGLADRLLPASEAAGKNRYLLLGGKLHRLPNGLLSFLKSDLLSWRGKLSLLAERFRSRGALDHDESVYEFARRRAGKEAADVFADALVTGIHAGDPDLLSLRAAFPRLAEFERIHGSVTKGFAVQARVRRQEARARSEPAGGPARMWSFREGLRVLIETLHERLGQSVVLGAAARRIERGDEADGRRPRWQVHADGSQPWPASALVLACPAGQQAELLADIDPDLARLVGGIPYNRVAVVALGYRRQDVPLALDGFGYIAPENTRRDLLGVQWCSSIFPQRAPADCVMLRAMCGGWHRGDIVGWDDARLVSAVRQELRLAMAIESPPISQTILRWDRAIPQYHVGHLERLAIIAKQVARHPGLYLAGNAYHGVALNDCTEQAEWLASTVAAYLGEEASQ
jgi:oxygen-dependent protoporphyrinogen oxidase